MGTRKDKKGFARERVRKRLIADPTLMNRQILDSVQCSTNKMIRDIRDKLGLNQKELK